MEILIGIFIACVIVSFAAGYGAKPAVPVPTKEKITIVDSAGRYVEIPQPLDRVVVLHSDAAEVICILGAENKVVGVNDYTAAQDSITKELGVIFENIPTVGEYSSPNYEKIAELHPQVVIAYESWPGSELEETLELFGIRVVRLNCYKPDTLINDIKTMGLMLGKTEEADGYISFIQSWLEEVENRLETLESGERVRVYFESATGYTSNSEGTAHKLMTLAGGINIAAAEPVPYPKLSAEWVLEQNPDVVVKLVSKMLQCGYGVSDTGDLEGFMEDIVNRPGWREFLNADERVHLLSQAIWLGPRVVVGMCYMAKWFYPQLFVDLDPEAIHRTILENYLGLEYRGVFTYP